jgi:hypothetical protein
MTLQPTELYNDITELQIADGLKELLIDHGFTREKILRLQATQLATILGVEDYIGKIIYNAAKPKS